MEPKVIVVLFFAILALFLAISCFSHTKRTRVIGAIVAFGWACLMFTAANMVETFNLNIWYSQAADNLLESSIDAIHAGDGDRVATELTAMRDELQVTYEFRGNFRELAIATTDRIRNATKVESKETKKPNKAEMATPRKPSD